MIETTSVTSRLIGLVAEVFMVDPLPLSPQSTAADIPGWDSVSQVMLSMRIEDEFGVSLAPELVNEASNLGELALLVARSAAS
jgi:acyl carrier protein